LVVPIAGLPLGIEDACGGGDGLEIFGRVAAIIWLTMRFDGGMFETDT
jgi:hypothetical protein